MPTGVSDYSECTYRCTHNNNITRERQFLFLFILRKILFTPVRIPISVYQSTPTKWRFFFYPFSSLLSLLLLLSSFSREFFLRFTDFFDVLFIAPADLPIAYRRMGTRREPVKTHTVWLTKQKSCPASNNHLALRIHKIVLLPWYITTSRYIYLHKNV